MDLLDIMKKRRSVRKFTGESVSEEQLQTILQAALLAPTSRGRRSWEFIVVQDKNMIKELSKCRVMGSAFLQGADKAIIVVGDKELTDVWIEDCSIAMAHMYLMADALGLGSCWIQGRNRMANDQVSTGDYVKRLLKIPEQYELEAIFALGIAENHPEEKDLNDLPYEKIHHEYF